MSQELTELRAQAVDERKAVAALRLGIEAYVDGRIVAADPDQALSLEIPDEAQRKSFINEISPAWGQIHAFVQSVRLTEKKKETDEALKEAMKVRDEAAVGRERLDKRMAGLESREREVELLSNTLTTEKELFSNEKSIDIAIKIGIMAINRGGLLLNSNGQLAVRVNMNEDRKTEILSVLAPVINQASAPIVAYANALAREAQHIFQPLQKIFASLPPEQKATVIAQDPAAENMLEGTGNWDQFQHYLNIRRGAGRG